MFAYLLTFVAGVGTGAGLLIANNICVKNAVKAERAHSRSTIDRLKKERDEAARERSDLIRERDWNTAYHEGRKNPMPDVERFAETLEKQRNTVLGRMGATQKNAEI